MDTGLRRGIEGDLLPGIRLFDHDPYGRALLYWKVGPDGATGEDRLHHHPEEPGLTAKAPIDRLHHDPGLRRDLDHRRA